MPDPMTFANNRPARFVASADAAIELTGRSAAVVRAQELVRRAAVLDTGVLIVAERGSDAESVARELHVRSRSAASPWIPLECAGGDAGSLDHADDGFGRQPEFAPTDLESVSADSRLTQQRRAAGRFFCRTSASCPPRCRRGSRASLVTAKCESMARRSGPACVSSPARSPRLTPRSGRIASAPTSIAAWPPRASTCPRFATASDDVPTALAERLLEGIALEPGRRRRGRQL